ncbi:MAG TPA: Ig-like domain-containing protein, partial [Terriglobales bacterium]|nr:Ig-like domain-containing protein [Terriglobales bacterium]
TICRPIQGSTVDSPTTITAVSGNSVTWMEIWEGGIKRKQGAEHSQEVTLTLGPGTHTATVFGKVGTTITDKKQVTFTVAGSGGGTCAPSSATTAVICSPAANSTVSSPVAVNAKGGSSVNYMEAWVDGVKKGNVNSNTLSLSVGLAAGQHRLTVYAKVNGTITDKQTEYFTVK